MNKSEITEVAHKNMTLWMEKLTQKNLKGIVSLYDNNASLLPTCAKGLLSGQNEIKNYFVTFLTKNPKAEIKEENITLIDEDYYLHVGIYNFTLKKEGGTVIIHARFSYLWQKNKKGKWKIVHHHSSLNPEG